MKQAFNSDHFHRFIWFDPISKDPKICNPKRVAELAKDLHATVLHYVATAPLTGKVFYPSKFRPKEYFLGPDEDYLKQAVEECHKRDIKLVAYFNCHWVSADNLPSEAKWIATYKDGSLYGAQASYGGKGTCPCINSPDFLEASKQILQEIAANYEIDGVFYDGPSIPLGTCYCETCRALFKAKTGADLPTEPNWGDEIWNAYVQFRFDSMARYFRETSAAIKAKRDIPVYKNGFALCASWFSAIKLEHDAETPDLIGGEHFVFYNEPLKTPIFGGGAAAKYYRAVARGRVPSVTYCCYSHKCWDYYTLPTADIKQIIAEVASNGCYPFVTIDDYTSVSDPQNFEGIRDMFGFIEKHEHLYKIPPRQNVALLWSQTSADCYARGELAGAGGTHHFVVTSPKEYENEVKGFYDLLTQAHIPFDIITESGVEHGDLKNYDCLVMANTACLSEKQADKIREFVREGGLLVSSHEVSLYQPDGTLRKDFLLGDVLGVTTGGIKDAADLEKRITKSKWDYEAPLQADHAIFEAVQKKYIPAPILTLRVQAKPGATALACFMEKLPCRYLAFKGSGLTDDPAIVMNRFGKGCSYYFGGTIGEQFFNYNVRDARNMVNSVIRKHIKVPVDIKDEPAVSVSLAEDDRTAVLHLINWAARVKRPVEKIYPVYDVKVELSGFDQVRKVKALMLDQELPVARAGKNMTVTLPRLDGYEVLVLEKRPA
jgi:hypothetical protein